MIFLNENLKRIRTAKNLTQQGFADLLGLKKTTYANYETGFSSPDFLVLHEISKQLGYSVDELLYNQIEAPEPGKNTKKVQQNIHPTVHLIAEKPVIYTQNRRVFSPEVITVDASGQENILRVPVKAKLGYAAHYNDSKFLQKLEAYRLPGVRNGTFRMFDTEGPSMAPTIHGGDIVVGRYVESFSDVKDRRVYVIVTKDGYVVKRVLNRVSERSALVCLSDTVAHRLEYPTYQIDALEVRELWECKWKFSPNFAEPSDIYNRLNGLESDVSDLRLIVEDLRADLSTFKAPKRSK